MSPRTSSAREPERRHPHPGSSRTRRNARMASPWLGYHSGSWRCSLRQRDHAVVAGRLAAEVVVLADARLVAVVALGHLDDRADRKSTRLNSSHLGISYVVFCLKKKKQIK